jgi:hypothetical protein
LEILLSCSYPGAVSSDQILKDGSPHDEIASLEPSLRGAFTGPLLLLILFAPRQSYEGIPEVSNNEIASLPRAF